MKLDQVVCLRPQESEQQVAAEPAAERVEGHFCLLKKMKRDHQDGEGIKRYRTKAAYKKDRGVFLGSWDHSEQHGGRRMFSIRSDEGEHGNQNRGTEQV